MAHDSFFGINEIMLLLPDDLSNKRILDVGFGCGTVIYKIISTSGRPWTRFKGIPTVIGIDIDQTSIDFAKKWMPFYKEVYVRDITDIPYPDEIISKKLDIIICSEVMEHTLDKKRSVETIKYLSTLAPLVIITCPNGDHTTELYRLYKESWHNHNTIWYPKDLEQFGFKTKLVSPYPKSIEWFIRIIKRIFTGKPLSFLIVAWKDTTKM